MADVKISELAKTVGVSVDKLLAQIKEAGLPHLQPDELISNDDKNTLLVFLRRSHGDREATNAAPKKITLKRKTIGTLKSSSNHGRGKTVNVEVRKKRTYVKRGSVSDEKNEQQEAEAEILKKEAEAARLSEEKALKELKNFVKERIQNYSEARNFPNLFGTSKLSPYIKHGQIHVETIWQECIKIKKQGVNKYLTEIGWREFNHSLINFFPHMTKGNYSKKFDKFPWEKNKNFLNAWKKGLTGYPIVDAGMRELYLTGWMHNRVRMIVGSFLVKHLLIDWKEGEKHFKNCLLDYSAANNVAGWQWVAGCGADAAPYFRIFNPILQGEKFDKDGQYVRKWVPELKNLPNKFIHKPWEASLEKFKLGKDYPFPIVRHEDARAKALNAFKKI